jgi:RNA polymerase sigma factor (sigma-70 family)
MDNEALELLLDRLCNGDAGAAEHVFLAFEPYLRKVVRRMLPPALRSRFDSADVVQSIWADLLSGFRSARWHFNNVAHLRAFLVRVTHNRFIDRIRQAGPAGRVGPLTAAEGVPGREPRPSECVQAEDVWEKLLALCPPAHREVVLLRRQGLSRAEVAARTGMHEGSVRRILRGLARRLAFPDPDVLDQPE